MDGHPERQAKRTALCGAGTEVPHGPTDGEAIRAVAAENCTCCGSWTKPVYGDSYTQVLSLLGEITPKSKFYAAGVGTIDAVRKNRPAGTASIVAI